MDKFEVDCPECHATLRLTIDDVARQRTVTCVNGHQVELVDEGGHAKQAQKELKKLDESVKKLGGTIKFKF